MIRLDTLTHDESNASQTLDPTGTVRRTPARSKRSHDASRVLQDVHAARYACTHRLIASCGTRGVGRVRPFTRTESVALRHTPDGPRCIVRARRE